MNTGERIRQLRMQRNMPQQALADSLGVTRQAVAKWESGASAPQRGQPDGAVQAVRRFVAAAGRAGRCPAEGRPGVIGYADAPAKLFVAGTPACYMCCRLWRALRPWRPPQPFCI